MRGWIAFIVSKNLNDLVRDKFSQRIVLTLHDLDHPPKID
jgi:hypothetical protein